MSAPSKKSSILVQGIMPDAVFEDFRKRGIHEVVVCEGRPQLKPLKTNCRRLLKQKMTPTVIADNMAGFCFYKGMLKEVWLSYYAADEGGALCDIGALILAVLAKKHAVPVNCVPSGGSTAYLGKPRDILYFNGQRVSTLATKGYVPLVEWVPKKYISKIYE